MLTLTPLWRKHVLSMVRLLFENGYSRLRFTSAHTAVVVLHFKGGFIGGIRLAR
jgi:hypothetical protein